MLRESAIYAFLEYFTLKANINRDGALIRSFPAIYRPSHLRDSPQCKSCQIVCTEKFENLHWTGHVTEMGRQNLIYGTVLLGVNIWDCAIRVLIYGTELLEG